MPDSFFDFPVYDLPKPSESLPRKALDASVTTLVLVEKEVIDDAQLTLLNKILGAVKLDMQQQVALIQLTPNEIFKFSQLRTFTNIKYLLLFGCPWSQISIQASFPDYQVINFRSKQLLRVDSLDKINDKAFLPQKKALWASLQNMYQIK